MPGMPGLPRIVVPDVNETLSDLAPLGARFEAVGVPAHLMATWFAALLRDGFTLTSVGEAVPFAVLARDGLRDVLAGRPPAVGVEAAVEQIMDGFVDLDLHPDVEPGLRALRRAGLQVVTLSNGAASR